jgi:pyruvate dehydrogenase phosphatase
MYAGVSLYLFFETVIASTGEQGWKAEVLSANHNGRDEEEAARIRAAHPNEEECLLQDRVLGSIAVTRGNA